jgi:hypothetical protein
MALSATLGRSERPLGRSERPPAVPAVLVGALACAFFGCGTGEPRETVGFSTEQLFGGAAVSECQWTNVVAMNDACSGVLLHHEIVVYAAHCGTTLSRVWSSSQEVAIRDCRTLPNAALGGTDIAYCRLAEPFLADIIPPATGCENAGVQPGASVVMVGYGIDRPDGQFGIRRMSAGVIAAVTDNEVIVSGPDAGICDGDSGGALLMDVPDPAVGGHSLRVVGIASASPAGPCRQSESHYARLAPSLDWLEKQSGFDLTPCGATDGTWSPTLDCVGPQFHPGAVCTDVSRPGWSATCGKPFVPNPMDTLPPHASVTRPRAGEVFYLDGSNSVTVPIVVEARDDAWGVRSVSVAVLDSTSGVVWSDKRSIAPYDFGTVRVSRAGGYTLRAVVSNYTDNTTDVDFDFDVRKRGSGCSVPYARWPAERCELCFWFALYTLAMYRRSRKGLR